MRKFKDLEPMLPVSHKRVSTVQNSSHQECITDLNDSNSSQKPKDQTLYVTFLVAFPTPEVCVTGTLQKFHVC